MEDSPLESNSWSSSQVTDSMLSVLRSQEPPLVAVLNQMNPATSFFDIRLQANRSGNLHKLPVTQVS
jgi:hypothetical protein